MARPEKVFKMGGVRASIFRNTIVRNGESIDLPKVVLEVRYRDKSGQWQGTNSLSINDLPKAVSALQQAFEYLLGVKAKHTPGDSSESDSLLPASTDEAPRSDSYPVTGYKPKITTWKPEQGL